MFEDCVSASCHRKSIFKVTVSKCEVVVKLQHRRVTLIYRDGDVCICILDMDSLPNRQSGRAERLVRLE